MRRELMLESTRHLLCILWGEELVGFSWGLAMYECRCTRVQDVVCSEVDCLANIELECFYMADGGACRLKAGRVVSPDTKTGWGKVDLRRGERGVR